MPDFINELSHSQNPYLLQHKDNPVAWRVWDKKPFEEARLRNAPLLVSIGYSTCHWCHVMAHEVFEDAESARLMNENLVCIKVDREEHPEVDNIYMEACQTMNGSGGWPLNVFLDFDGKPFFALTYLPKKGWNELVLKISKAWKENREEIDNFANQLSEILQKRDDEELEVNPESIIDNLFAFMEQYYDHENPDFSGTGRAPRFPSHALFYFLLSNRTIPGQIASMLESTLEAIQDSGLHDRVGGGFHRYSTDVHWRIPHFEKMLYDNAQLMSIYAMAASRFNRKDFLDTAKHIAEYLLRDESIYEGSEFVGFASAEDADDPGGEGSFYAWTPQELKAVLGDALGEKIAREWNISNDPTHIHGVFPYKIPHPRGSETFKNMSAEEKLTHRQAWSAIYSQLAEVRNKRPRPFRDTKVLTDWNALALMGFSILYAHDNDQSYKTVIHNIAKIIIQRFQNGTLYRLPDKKGNLTDYGHAALGLFTAWEVTRNNDYLEASTIIANAAFKKFISADGRLITSEKDATLFMQYEEKYDHAQPAGAHSLLLAWVRLNSINRLTEYKLLAMQIAAKKIKHATQFPIMVPIYLCVLNEMHNGPWTLTIPLESTHYMHFIKWAGTNVRLIVQSDTEQYQFCEKDKCLLPVSSPGDLENIIKFHWK